MSQTPIPFSSSFRSLMLNVTTGTSPNQVTHTQAITPVFQGNNSVPITDANILNAFNSQPMGTSFTSSIVAEYGSEGNGNALTTISTPSVASFVPRPPPPISLASNNVTIQYNGNASTIPDGLPLFIEANPRGTGNEWFAVITDAHKENLKDYIGTHVVAGTPPTPYGLSGAGVSSFFTPPGQSAPVNMNNIITTLVTDMFRLFLGRFLFNNTLASWDTSNVTNMSEMFSNQAQSDSRTYGFNHPSIQYWNTSKVQNFSGMFGKNYAFKQDVLNGWDTSSATNMSSMFYEYDFDLTLTNWNTSNVVNMENMFRISYQTKDVSMWNVTNVTNWVEFKTGTSSLFTLERIPLKFRDGTAG